jgi:hypothetical protein
MTKVEGRVFNSIQTSFVSKRMFDLVAVRSRRRSQGAGPSIF